MAKDYYGILGVSRDASQTDIKKAFRKMAQEHHPDKHGGDDSKFKEINQAYEVLKDPNKRGQYDQFGEAAFSGGASGAGFGDFSSGGGFGDIFNMFFGGQYGGSSRGFGGGRQETRGNDLEYVVEIGFEEAVFGGEKKIEYNRQGKCTTCKGSGGDPGATLEECSECHGTGEIRKVRQSMLGQIVQAQVCHKCQGQGRKYTKACEKCGGNGRLEEKNSLKITIPAGVEDGNRMRLRSEGDAGMYGGASGDLFILFRVKEHEVFQRQGTMILSDIHLDYVQLVLGDQIEVDTVHGKEMIQIKPGTKVGEQIVLKGKGAPNLRTGKKGDHLINVFLDIPKKVSKMEKELLHKLAVERKINLSEPDPGLVDKIKEGLGL